MILSEVCCANVPSYFHLQNLQRVHSQPQRRAGDTAPYHALKKMCLPVLWPPESWLTTCAKAITSSLSILCSYQSQKRQLFSDWLFIKCEVIYGVLGCMRDEKGNMRHILHCLTVITKEPTSQASVGQRSCSVGLQEPFIDQWENRNSILTTRMAKWRTRWCSVRFWELLTDSCPKESNGFHFRQAAVVLGKHTVILEPGVLPCGWFCTVFARRETMTEIQWDLAAVHQHIGKDLH